MAKELNEAEATTNFFMQNILQKFTLKLSLLWKNVEIYFFLVYLGEILLFALKRN